MKNIKKTVALGAACSILVFTLASCSGGDVTAPTLSRLDRAKAAYSNALAAQTNAEQTLADARLTLQSHSSELDSLRSGQAARSAAIANAEQAKRDGESTYQQKQQETLTAQSTLEQVQKDQADARKYQNNSLGFFIWNAEDSGSDIELIQNYFLGKVTGSTESVPDLNSSTDATSLQNFKASIQWINKCNEIRQRENKAEGTDLKDLLITDYAMAAAQLHANYASRTPGHHGSTGTCKFGLGENLAWGTSYNTADDPFKAWYTDKKVIFKQNPVWSGSTGHYINIVSGLGYDYKETGFAINTDPSGYFSRTYAQEFGYANRPGKLYTTTEYRARIAAYESYLGALDTVLSNAKQAATTAANAEEAAKNQLTILDSNIQKAKKVDKDALERIEALPAIIAADNTAIQTAEQDLEAKKHAVADALAELNAAQEAQDTAAQTALETYLMTA